MPELKHRILTVEELQRLFRLKGYIGKCIARLLMMVFKLRKLNLLYDRCYDDDPIRFATKCINAGRNRVFISDQDISQIPETGPCVVLFNHPYGGLDALVIIRTLIERRPDTRFIANFLLSRVEPVAHLLMQVNPFETRKSAFSSHNGLKEMYSVIENGGVVCILPAGEVSTRYGKSKRIEDREWQSNMMKFVRSVGVPVVSAYISGQNSWLFHFLGKIHPSLRTACLPRELLNKRNLDITVRFSQPAPIKFFKSLESNKDLANVLRARTYCLEPVQQVVSDKSKTVKYKDVIPATEQSVLRSEIEKIRDTDLLFCSDSYQIFFSEKQNIPSIFKELSRLREITFREIGEGTGNELDSDQYDEYYHHLFIWDDSASALVGAYRIGLGAEIINKNGVNGFYLNTLFNFKEKFIPYLSQSMEMGRSFIVQEYQRKPLPLFLLWKGIYFVTQRYPDYRFLIGPASISSLYSHNAKVLIIEYLKRHHSWPELSDSVSNNISFNYEITFHQEILLQHFGNDISAMDRIIKDIDVNHFGIPVLIKKYLSLGGRILEFNVDPDFNYAIDGFVVLDIAVVSEEVINSYNK